MQTMNYIVIGQIDNLSDGLDGSMNFSNIMTNFNGGEVPHSL